MYVHCCSPFFSSLPAQDAEGSSHQIKQFHYTGWPMEGVPNSAIGLLDIREQVEKWQRNSGDKPIVVHCRYCTYSRIITPSTVILLIVCFFF